MQIGLVTVVRTPIVHDHVDRCAKNKHMFRFLDTWVYFNLHKSNIFHYHIGHTYTTYCNIQTTGTVILETKKRTLTSNGGSLNMAANPYPCWGPLLKANCPVLGPPPPIPLLPTNAVLLYIKMALTCPILLLSGTLMLAKYHRQLYYPVVVEINRQIYSIQVHIPVNQTYQELLQVDRGSTTASHTDGRQFAVADRSPSGQKAPPIIQVVRGSSCQISLNIVQKTQYEKQTELEAVRYRCPSYW